MFVNETFCVSDEAGHDEFYTSHNIIICNRGTEKTKTMATKSHDRLLPSLQKL